MTSHSQRLVNSSAYMTTPMALRPVLQFPDKRLVQRSVEIDTVTDEIRALAADMCEIMYDEPGIGLATPQVAAPVRLIVVDTAWTEEDAEKNPLILVNPELSEHEGKIVWKEGCLSVPEFEADRCFFGHSKPASDGSG